MNEITTLIIALLTIRGGKITLYSKNDIKDVASERSDELLELGDKGILHRLNEVIKIFKKRT